MFQIFSKMILNRVNKIVTHNNLCGNLIIKYGSSDMELKEY